MKQVNVIQAPTSQIQKEFYAWKTRMKDNCDIIVHDIAAHTYEDREDNFQRSALIITYSVR